MSVPTFRRVSVAVLLLVEPSDAFSTVSKLAAPTRALQPATAVAAARAHYCARMADEVNEEEVTRLLREMRSREAFDDDSAEAVEEEVAEVSDEFLDSLAEVSTPDFSMPTISMPDISMPSFSNPFQKAATPPPAAAPAPPPPAPVPPPPTRAPPPPPPPAAAVEMPDFSMPDIALPSFSNPFQKTPPPPPAAAVEEEVAAVPEEFLESLPEVSTEPAGLPEPLAKALDAMQEAATEAAESAVASARDSVQQALEEAKAVPQRAFDTAKEAVEMATEEAKGNLLEVPNVLKETIAGQLTGTVEKAQFPLEIAKAKRDAKKAELEIQRLKMKRKLGQ